MAQASITEVCVPQIGESIKSAFIGQWMKGAGEYVEAGEPLVEIESDKATLEVPAPVSGRVVETLAGEGDEVLIGAPIAQLDSSAEAPAPASKAPDEDKHEDTAPGDGRSATLSRKGPQSGPAARQEAAASGVDIQTVQGTGVRGRVLRSDVVAARSEGATDSGSQGQALEERVVMSPLRRTIAQRLVQAQHTTAMLTTFNEVDLTEIKALRKRYQESFVSRYGVKLGFMSFFLKATVEALKSFPAVNAEIDDSNPDRPAVVYKRYYNIGVAVSTKRGLMVPVLRDADQLSFAETEQAIGELARRGRDGKLQLADFKGGTFTISNGGVFGSLMSTPILNPPQVGILGMHTIQERPVGVEGRIELRPMMYLALSYDHRIIDGREAVGFLKRIKELVESPERILIEI
jgi:2-oxoglutarate dehydrogenase E2 component (dihydrolipoamide succinyltransferase)